MLTTTLVLLLSRLRRLGAATALAAGMGVVATAGAVAAAPPTGPDVSGWQHRAPLAWSTVSASGQAFVFVKATEGATFTNSFFASDWTAARRVGLLRGAYHYARPSLGSAVPQARRFIAVAGTAGLPGDLPPVLDLEEDGGLTPVQLSAWARQFLEETRRLTGRTPLIYTYPNFWRGAMAGTTAFADYPLWIASYTSGPSPVMPGWQTWTFWQYTAAGRLPGIAGPVDLNRYNGSLTNLRRLANNAPSTATITARLSSTSTTVGTPVTLRGTVAPAVAGQTLYRQGFYSGAWHTWATTRVGSSGAYRFTITPTKRAVNRYRVYLPATSTRPAAASRTVRLTVR